MNFRPQTALSPALATPLVDPFGRAISYLRVSVTDRCDFRCVYCMSEDMSFLPKRRPAHARGTGPAVHAPSSRRGTRKLRLTGGEPLVRRGIMTLFRAPRAPSRFRRARRTDADDQWLAARAFSRRSSRPAACGASMSRSTRCDPGEIPRDHPARRSRPACSPGIEAAQRGRPRRQDQHGGAEGRQRGRSPLDDRLGA